MIKTITCNREKEFEKTMNELRQEGWSIINAGCMSEVNTVEHPYTGKLIPQSRRVWWAVMKDNDEL